MEHKLLQLKSCYGSLSKYNSIDYKEGLIGELKKDITKLRSDYDNLSDEKAKEIKTLYDKILHLETMYASDIVQRNNVMNHAEVNLQRTEQELDALQNLILLNENTESVDATERSVENNFLESDTSGVTICVKQTRRLTLTWLWTLCVYCAWFVSR